MKVIATTLSTEPGTKEAREGLLAKVLRKAIPAANPDMEARYQHVRLWWVEIDDRGTPQREIGFDASGTPVVVGPIGRNMGFWTDSPMIFVADEHEPISQHRFEEVWSRIEADPNWKRIACTKG